ncbi:MAG: tetratricopeptide repeat protein [Candidatus Omnitrophica bacterium]|nr:tetratricopeptide repeat protein [Candidatus Omnitrophota bacterium]MCM8802404.1 tetratricopeptide repeat protein [Candidatus Omnitrophota bacterium]
MGKRVLIIFIIMTFLTFAQESKNLINEGILYLKAEEYEKAINTFNQLSKTSSENSDVYYYLGEAYFRKGEIDKAISNLQKAININPQNSSYYYTLALIYLSQNNKNEAIDALNKVISISPLSFHGKNAQKLKDEIEKSEKEIQIAKKWEQLEIEEKKRKEEEKKEIEGKTTFEGQITQEEKFLPHQLPEMSPSIETPESEKKLIPISTIIKRIKFGTEEVRKKASNEIIVYPSSEIEKVIDEILSIIENTDQPEIKRNLIIAAGKVYTDEVIDMLLKIIKDEKELFEIRIVALDIIGNIKSEKVVEELRNALVGMVSKREKEREEARKNIQDINQKLDDLTARKIVLNSETQNLNNRISQIDNQLNIFPEEFQFPQGAPGTAPGGRRPLTDKETKKLLEEKRTIEEKIKTNNEEIVKIDKELVDLTEQKRKYEELLELRKRKIDISGIGASAVVVQLEEQSTIPKEFIFPSPDFSYTQRETDEQKNEIIFVVKLINALANLRDTNSLSIIKKAWREFGVPGLRSYYYIALGKLGEYRSIDFMVSRLKENYPQGNKEEEIYIRANIIEVLGEYLKQNYDEEIKGLIEYLAEEGEYPLIISAAKKVISSLPKEEVVNQ